LDKKKKLKKRINSFPFYEKPKILLKSK